VGDIKIRLFVPAVFLLEEQDKGIVLLKPGESKTVTFEIRPTGECGDCEISGRVTYYDYASEKTKETDIPAKSLSIVCPILKTKKIEKAGWKDIVSRLIQAEESTKDIEISAETLFTMVSRVIEDKNMFMLEPEITSSVQLFNGVARFYAEGVKELKYAAHVEVLGGVKKSKLILKAWAEKEEALTGFYHGILDEIEKRIHIKGYIEGINVFVKGDYFAEGARKVEAGGDYQEGGAIKTGDIGMVKGGIGSKEQKGVDQERKGREEIVNGKLTFEEIWQKLISHLHVGEIVYTLSQRVPNTLLYVGQDAIEVSSERTGNVRYLKREDFGPYVERLVMEGSLNFMELPKSEWIGKGAIIIALLATLDFISYETNPRRLMLKNRQQ